MQRTCVRRPQCRGFTLIEMCIVLGISGLLLALAIPSLVKFKQEQTLRATAEAVGADLRLARSEAMRLGTTVFFRISSVSTQACYLLFTGSADDCNCAGGAVICKPTAQLIKVEWLSASQPVRIYSNVETLQFQRRQGLVTKAGSIELSLDSGAAIRQVVAFTGRVRSCNSGTAKVGNLKKC